MLSCVIYCSRYCFL